MGQSNIVHDFKKDLEWSELPSQYILYMQAIQYWWPETISWNRITDLEGQKDGKDATIYLPNNKTIKLQFKIRKLDYGDLCIEYRHDYYNGGNSLGWIAKDSDADFLIYCTPKSTYRINYKDLHSTWKKYGNLWIKLFDLPPAKNKSYDTRNISIDFDVLTLYGVKVERKTN
jgi:hypothetical protein